MVNDHIQADDSGLIFGEISEALAEDERIRISAHQYVALAFDRDHPYIDFLLTNVPQEDRSVSVLTMLRRASDHYCCHISKNETRDGRTTDVGAPQQRRLHLDFRFDAADRALIRCDDIIREPRYYTPDELSEIFTWLPERIRRSRDIAPDSLQKILGAIRAHGIVVSEDGSRYRFETKSIRNEDA